MLQGESRQTFSLTGGDWRKKGEFCRIWRAGR
jgi:hypothetical protein